MQEIIPPAKKALADALDLSEEALREIESTDSPLSRIALKANRLAGLLNEWDMQRLIDYEIGGYPLVGGKFTPEVWQFATAAGRTYDYRDPTTGQTRKTAHIESIEELEQKLDSAKIALTAARDPDISLSSANPRQWLQTPGGNTLERQRLQKEIVSVTRLLSNRRAFFHMYLRRKHYALKFSGIADDIFTRIRQRVDQAIGERVPDAVQKLSSAYESLQSDNPENWSNAVHKCRRILEDLADVVFAPQEDGTVELNGVSKKIKLGPQNYKNRIIAYVNKHSDSARFSDIVGSQLKFLGERLDAVFGATQKGSHSTIIRREEADRYVVYTYLIVGDVLSLKQ